MQSKTARLKLLQARMAEQEKLLRDPEIVELVVDHADVLARTELDDSGPDGDKNMPGA